MWNHSCREVPFPPAKAREVRMWEITSREHAGLPRYLDGFRADGGGALKLKPSASKLAMPVAYVNAYGGRPRAQHISMPETKKE